MSDDIKTTVKRANLLYVGLSNSAFHRSPDAIPLHDEDAGHFIDQQLHNEVSFDESRNVYSCLITNRLWIGPTVDDDSGEIDVVVESSKLWIRATYLVAFSIDGDEEVSDQSVRLLFERTGLMSVWPYFRSHCAHYASEASIPLHPLLHHAME